MSKIKKVFLFYPPGDLYQRGEDRSQGNITNSTATSMRAPNDMAYISAQLKKKKIEVFFIDYASENKTYKDLEIDFLKFNPDLACISTTTSTIKFDIKIVEDLKKISEKTKFVIKGSLFFSAPLDLLTTLNLGKIDYLVGGEIEFALSPLINKINNNSNDLTEIPGIFYKENGEWKSTRFGVWNSDIDSLPFPDRSIIKNNLYVRPDTKEAQATIATSRGCPSACVYCLTPYISGKSVRFRDPKKVLEEISDCFYNHNIKNFFFKSDTFTINKQWVLELCNEIKKSSLYRKINWVANSRVKPLEKETLVAMKEAGCWLVAFGFESGSNETLKKIKKGANIDDNLRAARLTKEAGLKLYGFYLIGLPWEDMSHLELTKKHLFQTNPDFVELHIALPYYGTELYDMAKAEGILTVPVIGQNYFEEATTGTKHLSSKDLINFRKKLLFSYHVQPSFVAKKMKDILTQPKKFPNYFKYGVKLIQNTFF